MKITLAFLLVALAHSCLSDPVQIKPTSTVEFNHFWTFDEVSEAAVNPNEFLVKFFLTD
jgi:hypothetical protein